MKTIILLLVLCVALIQNALSASLPENLGDGPKFTVTIELGKRPSCSWAFALCKISVGGENLVGTAESFPYGSGGGSGGGGGGTWILSIPRNGLVTFYPEALSGFDGKSSIVFEDSYVLPSDVSAQLGVKGDLMVKANTPYPLRYENGEFKIMFPL